MDKNEIKYSASLLAQREALIVLALLVVFLVIIGIAGLF